MNLVLTPKKLTGTVTVPSSKSQGHRELICAALAQGDSIVGNITASEDITATCRILRQMGAAIQEISDGKSNRMKYYVHGGLRKQETPLTVHCGESGSTLRFLIPVGLISGNTVTYTGSGRLAERPLQPYYDVFDKCDVHYEIQEKGLPLQVSGGLTPGRYALPGNISSQFFTGLLLALPLIQGDSLLCSTTPLESASYVDMTLACLKKHGIVTEKKENGTYFIPGQQHFQAGKYMTEGDYSQAAFWLAAGIIGKKICCQGLQTETCQGDKAIISIIRRMGGSIYTEDSIITTVSKLQGTVIDAADCPDLVPILTVLASVSRGITHIIHAGRVRLKECDRLHAMAVELNKLGADVREEPEGLLICGVDHLRGGRVSAWGDHRIAMSLAIASQCCNDKVIVEGAVCVRKSYPGFWNDYSELGGIVEKEG